MNLIRFLRKSNCSFIRHKFDKNIFIKNFVAVNGLAIILCAFLSLSFGEAMQADWVQPCQMSREGCDKVCGVEFRKPLFWACHQTSGYCLCPKSSKPGEHCRRPRTKRETLTCRTSVCMSIKKKTKKHKKSMKRTDRRKKFRGNAAGAMICSDAQRGNKMYCACFIKSSTKPHSILVKSGHNKTSVGHELITAYKDDVI